MKRHLLLLATALYLLVPDAFAQSKVPSMINYQGNVRNAAGVPIGSGTPVNRAVTFRFYKSPTSVLAADRLWSERQTVTLLDGNFNVLIGNGTPVSGETNAVTPFANVFGQSSAVYLGITVDDGNPGTVDAEISPRQQLVSGAFAFRATVAESVDNQAITTGMLAGSSVTANQLGTAAVTTGKIDNSAVTNDKIQNGTIQEGKLADGSVTSSKILDGTITFLDIAADTIRAGNIAPGAVASSEILDGSIEGIDIGNNTIKMESLLFAVQQALCPPGTIVAYGGQTAPSGWLLCNGQVIYRTTYPALFSAIGTSFGTNASTTFNLPDFRGRFLRGRDGGAGRDPDRTTRTAMATGGAIGDQVGSVQIDAFKSHTHSFTKPYIASRGDDGSTTYSEVANSEKTSTTVATGGNETRPINANVNYIIKY
jgi:microcystin-dependent protein